jgi:hypothetical protein
MNFEACMCPKNQDIFFFSGPPWGTKMRLEEDINYILRQDILKKGIVLNFNICAKIIRIY